MRKKMPSLKRIDADGNDVNIPKQMLSCEKLETSKSTPLGTWLSPETSREKKRQLTSLGSDEEVTKKLKARQLNHYHEEVALLMSYMNIPYLYRFF
jgi:hypothetical protein